MAFKRAVIEPTSKTLLNKVSVPSRINAYGISKITDITIWRINNDKRLLNQLLKKPSVEEVVRHKIAKGDIRTNTLTKIYLNAKLIIKANDEIESIPRQNTI